MSKIVRLEHLYNYSPEKVWAVATDWTCLKEAVKGLIVYHGLPEYEPIASGQVIKTQFQLFGILPRQDWTMEILVYDDPKFTLQSHEYGGAVTQWDHNLSIAPNEAGCTLVDEITIDAGASTGIYAMWAKFMYSRRHAPRLAMLARRAQESHKS